MSPDTGSIYDSHTWGLGLISIVVAAATMPAAPARRDDLRSILGAKNPLALTLLYVLVGPTNTCGYYDASHALSDSAYTTQKHDNTNGNMGTAFILRTRGSY